MRWILLGAGILFVLIVYLVGRSRRPNTFDVGDIDSEELPEFSANTGQNVDDSVRDIHISARESDDVYLESYADEEDGCIDDGLSETLSAEMLESDDNETSETSAGTEHDENDAEKETPPASDIVILTVISRTEMGLQGDKINSAALANNLKFGDMNIFHRMGTNAKPLFSMANMVEPGNFDPTAIHDLKTPGLTFFLQLPVDGASSSASAALTDLLQCAYQVTEMLDAELCNKQRKPLTEKDAEQLRKLAESYDSE